MSRQINSLELDLVRFFLEKVNLESNVNENSLVDDLDDGGMGSIKLIYQDPGVFSKKLLDAEYVDDDGVIVSLGLNLDDRGRLYDLDFWKVDFSPLKKYPNPSNIRSISIYN
ncbi:MAG TPA: hypothetical protein VGC19_15235 [Rhodanobacter sp.]